MCEVLIEGLGLSKSKMFNKNVCESEWGGGLCASVIGKEPLFSTPGDKNMTCLCEYCLSHMVIPESSYSLAPEPMQFAGYYGDTPTDLSEYHTMPNNANYQHACALCTLPLWFSRFLQ